ncbi:MAG: NnrU family protein [Bacteroidota bacterium]
MEYILLAASWIIFYTVHSLLAASKLKRILKEKLGSAYKWYRLFYSLLSILLFLGIIFQAILISPSKIWNESPWIVYLGYMLATFGTILAVKSSKGWSIRTFIGISPPNEEKENLLVTGWYSRMRHPLYASLVLLFVGYLLVAGTLTSLVHLLCLAVYLPFGIYFEEKNLIQKFGEDYLKYQKQVPAIFPKIRHFLP